MALDLQNVGRPPVELTAAGAATYIDDRILRGLGEPEGVVVGNVAQLYSQRDAIDSAGVWFKVRDDGMTTGWRRLKSDDNELNLLDYITDISDPAATTDDVRRFFDDLVALRGRGKVPLLDYPIEEPCTPVAGAGTVTVSGGAGAATFSTSQAGALKNGWKVTVGGATYLVSAFTGTTSCTLTYLESDPTYPNDPAPNFGASAFTITRAEVVLVEGPVCLEGEGRFVVQSTTPDTCDAVRLLGGIADYTKFDWGGIQIVPETDGTCGRHALNIDPTNGYIAYATFKGLKLGEFSAESLRCTNPAIPTPRQDNFFNATFEDCIFSAAMWLENCGDTISFKHNLFAGATQRNRVAQIASSTDSAHAFVLEHNTLINGGGTTFETGGHIIVKGNNIEAPYDSTQPRRATLDFQGTATKPLRKVTVKNNEIGVAFATGGVFHVDYGIVMDYVLAGDIHGNKMGPPAAPGLGYWLTSNSEDVHIYREHLHPFGIQMHDVCLDEGKNRVEWTAPSGTGSQRPTYLGMSVSPTNTTLFQAGYAQDSTSVILGVIMPRGDAITVTVAVAGAAIGATSIPLTGAIATDIPAYTILSFGGGKFATLSADATAGDSSLTVDALGAALSSGDTATWTGAIDYLSQGYFRVFGNGNVRVGGRTDTGAQFQVAGYSSFGQGGFFGGDLGLAKTAQVAGRDAYNTAIPILSFLASDNVLRIGTQATPTLSDGVTASGGEIFFLYRGAEIGRLTGTLLQLASTHSIKMLASASKLVPGATSFAVRNNADSANNLLLNDNGTATLRNTLTVSAGGIAVTGYSTIASLRVGGGADDGNAFQVNGSQTISSNLRVAGNITLGQNGKHVATDSAGTLADILTAATADNVVRLGYSTTVASNGFIIFLANGAETGRITSTVLQLASGVALKFATAAAKIVGGSTSVSLRNNADSADNVLVTDAGVVTIRSTLITAASATGAAGFRLPHGTAPSSPTNGDMWTDSSGAYVRINGTTKTFTLT